MTFLKIHFHIYNSPIYLRNIIIQCKYLTKFHFLIYKYRSLPIYNFKIYFVLFKLISLNQVSFISISLNSLNSISPSPLMSTSFIKSLHIESSTLLVPPNICFNSPFVIVPLLSLSNNLKQASILCLVSNFSLSIAAAIITRVKNFIRYI